MFLMSEVPLRSGSVKSLCKVTPAGTGGGVARGDGVHQDAAQGGAGLKPEPLNPQPSIPHPQPSTLNVQPYTLNPQPSTLHPQPSTLSSQP